MLSRTVSCRSNHPASFSYLVTLSRFPPNRMFNENPKSQSSSPAERHVQLSAPRLRRETRSDPNPRTLSTTLSSGKQALMLIACHGGKVQRKVSYECIHSTSSIAVLPVAVTSSSQRYSQNLQLHIKLKLHLPDDIRKLPPPAPRSPCETDSHLNPQETQNEQKGARTCTT